MKREVLLKTLRLTLIPLLVALIALFAAKTLRARKTACALDNRSERASISPSKPFNKSKASAGSTSESNASQKSAALGKIESRPQKESSPASKSSAKKSPTASSPQVTQSDPVKNEEAAEPSNTSVDSQVVNVQEVDIGQIKTSHEPPAPKECELLVKFKDGVSSEQIAAINAAYHTKTVEIINQIGVYRLCVTDGTPAQNVVDIYNNLPEVEYAELDQGYSTPEPSNNIQPIG